MTIWTAVSVTAPAELADSIASFLMDRGAPGLEIDDSGPDVTLIAHFAGPPPLSQLETFCDRLVEFFPTATRPKVSTAAVADDAWAENWKAHFPALAIGERLFVHPPWIAAVPQDRLGIVIEPGMAFGTGHHASTRGCLHLLESALGGRAGLRALDVGTGSGILAIAAAKLGAREVWALDTDGEARRVAAENAARNGVSNTIHLGAALGEAPGRFDLILANLFARQLIELTAELVARLESPGLLVGSGITTDECEEVHRAWHTAGLVAAGDYAEEGWVTLAFRKNRDAR